MASMIDCAKVADLVLLLIDASFGFEMVQGGQQAAAAVTAAVPHHDAFPDATPLGTTVRSCRSNSSS